MHRMLCIVSGQVLPNFIPCNEPATHPDALHAIFTGSQNAMAENWSRLRSMLKNKFPDMHFENISVKDAYRPDALLAKVTEHLDAWPADAWSLNATGGTKLMSAPLMNLFFSRNLPVYYVDTSRHCILKVNQAWQTEELPFQEKIELDDFFKLQGYRVVAGENRTGQERWLLEQLSRLNWTASPSVQLYDKGEHLLAEYDAVAIDRYQCTVFECKRLWGDDYHGQRNDSIRRDLLKLFQVREHFGGPFGRSCWVMGGNYPLDEQLRSLIKLCKVTLLPEQEIKSNRRWWQEYGFPAPG